jgi:hypothetical protein
MYIELPANLELCKFPPSAELMLFLISEEMKNRRHINRLVLAGFDTTYTCDLSQLIFTLVGFDTKSDSLYGWYIELLNESCEKTSPSDVLAWKEAAFDLYVKIKSRKDGR